MGIAGFFFSILYIKELPEIPQFQRFVTGLRSDYDAVRLVILMAVRCTSMGLITPLDISSQR
jgi:hypothetical protein